MISVKYCVKCEKQARCVDSRHGNGYIRRRYRCGCGRSWTTAEFLIEEGNSRDTYKVQRYITKRNKAAARGAIEKAIGALQALL